MEIEMRKYHLTGLGFMFSIFGFFVSFASAASISGTVTYEGSQSGSIVVAAFNYSLTCSGPYAADPNPYNIVELETFGNYTIPDLPDGTYYLASVISQMDWMAICRQPIHGQFMAAATPPPR